MRLLSLLLLLTLFVLPEAESRTRRNSNTVRKERSATERKIKETRRQINANLDDTRRELNRLTGLEGEMRRQDKDIRAMQRRVDSLRAAAKMIADSVAEANTRVEKLRASRADALRALRRQRQTANSATAFIFSSENFAQAYRRTRYLKELQQWQDSSAVRLAAAARVLEGRKARLDSTKTRLGMSLDTMRATRRGLDENTRAAKVLVASLKKQGRNLNKVLETQKKQAEKLDRELNRRIEEEARAAAEEARRQKEREEAARKARADGKPVPEEPAAPVHSANEGKSFAELKGKLPLPLDRKANIVSTFGRQSHSEYSKVQVQNNGIDFETSPGASARAVHSGTVTMVIVMEGYHNVVLLRHGEYLTVYAGLSDLRVRKGQKIAAGELLGTVYSDAADGNRTRLHFEVRHEKEKLNPAQWLAPSAR